MCNIKKWAKERLGGTAALLVAAGILVLAIGSAETLAHHKDWHGGGGGGYTGTTDGPRFTKADASFYGEFNLLVEFKEVGVDLDVYNIFLVANATSTFGCVSLDGEGGLGVGVPTVIYTFDDVTEPSKVAYPDPVSLRIDYKKETISGVIVMSPPPDGGSDCSVYPDTILMLVGASYDGVTIHDGDGGVDDVTRLAMPSSLAASF